MSLYRFAKFLLCTTAECIKGSYQVHIINIIMFILTYSIHCGIECPKTQGKNEKCKYRNGQPSESFLVHVDTKCEVLPNLNNI